MDRRLTAEDIDWLRKLTLLACAEVKGPGERSIRLRDRDELDRRKQGS